MESVSRPPRSRAPATPANAGAPAWATTSAPQRDPLREPAPAPVDVPRDEPAPATPGIFWVVAAVGIGLLLLAQLVLVFTSFDEIDGEAEGPILIGVFGRITLCVGLVLVALLQRGVPTGVRTAMMIAAAYFASAFSLFSYGLL
jgi:hypothetical protein